MPDPKHLIPLLFALAAADFAAAAEPRAIEEIIVTSSLRGDSALAEQTTSVAVLDAAAIRAGAAQHFEELIPQVPNLHWSGEGSRARYLQIRGIGELEQYEGAPNAAVGFLVDDIDFSGLGGVSTSFDLERVEVLRGPQGTRYGASALGGLVYLRSAAPPADAEFRAEAQLGGDDLWSAGLAAGGPVSGTNESLRWRVAAHRHVSDGYRDNATLGRDDTNGRDERTLRGRLAWTPAPDWALDLVALHVDLDNGYDAWSIDGGRTTWSDQPGRDTQRSDAAALKFAGQLVAGWRFTSITTAAETDVHFGYDADWGSAVSWAPHVYRYTDSRDRERRTLSQELRLSSAGEEGEPVAVFGAYLHRFDEDTEVHSEGELDIDDAWCEPDDESGYCDAGEPLDYTNSGDFAAETAAVFTEVEWSLASATTLSAGLRLERRSARYREPGPDFEPLSPSDRLWGGHLALRQAIGDRDSVYLRVARGFRASGFNPTLASIDPTEDQVSYGDESLLAIEAGWRTAGERGGWEASLNAFWQGRDDMQVKVPLLYRTGDPTTFLFLTDNAERARSAGLEAEWRWHLPDDWQIDATAAWLDTEIERFSAEPAFEGHEFPHAPRVSYALAVACESDIGWFGRLELTGRGSWRYDYDESSGDDRKEGATALVGLRAGYRWGESELGLWVRNVLDKDYGTRGFYFPNEPPAFEPRRYVRAGDPRQIGLRFTWGFGT